MAIFVETVGQYKSTWYETARNLFRSRNTQREIAERHTQQAEELRLENEQLRRKLRITKGGRITKGAESQKVAGTDCTEIGIFVANILQSEYLTTAQISNLLC